MNADESAKAGKTEVISLCPKEHTKLCYEWMVMVVAMEHRDKETQDQDQMREYCTSTRQRKMSTSMQFVVPASRRRRKMPIDKCVRACYSEMPTSYQCCAGYTLGQKSRSHRHQ